MHKSVTFEYPLNERVRALLRLEHLFKQVNHFLHGKSTWDSRVTVVTFMEILDIFTRGDLKTELMKEMERASSNLSPLLQIPEVDHHRLGTVLKALERLRGNLHAHTGQIGQELRENELLAAVRQRTTIPGGTCDFDLPAYHRWLEQPADVRHKDLEGWFATLDVVRQPVELVLKLLRSSAEPRQREAEGGVFPQVLDANVPFQLLRIVLPAEAPYYAEVSGGRHRFTIRFMQPGEGRAVQATENVTFQLSCCTL